MPSLFTHLINGTYPSHLIYEDATFFSFLDINPISPGHTLIVPKVETDYFFEMPDDELSAILTVAKPIASAIRSATSCARVGMMVAGLDVPHAHLHLVPITCSADLSFSKASPATPSDLSDMATRIRNYLD